MAISRRYLANAIRALSMDAVEKAKSGHPGMPMGMADIAEVLWNDYLKHSPSHPNWPDRDRFIVSNGHGSMLLYALLHLSGYNLSIEDLKQFRQLNSKTPGHPEYRETPGVETTTGPLGQGLANAVGMAIAEKVQAAQFNKDDFDIINHYTYVFTGDGCLMEGISHEACSLAGTLGLGKLIVFYDDNKISIDGNVKGWFTDDTPDRFRAYGWEVISEVDGHNSVQIISAIDQARESVDRPTLICCKTIIGWGSPHKQGTESCHGAPLGNEEVELTRENIGWTHPPFEIPEKIYKNWNAVSRGEQQEILWRAKYSRYKLAYPKLAAEYERRLSKKLPDYWGVFIKQFISDVNAKAETIATRKASSNSLNAISSVLPELIGGSADLAESNLTINKNSKVITNTDAGGNYIYFGVREFAMSAISNGIVLHGGFIPFCATFLMFSEYARNALRMAALMKISSIFVFTHDSIGLGEDGPTHQPIEQAATIRMIPGMTTWRPADSVETTVAWKTAIENSLGPTSLMLTRQNVAYLNRTQEQIKNISKGGYVLRDCSQSLQAIIIATGSEVACALEAWEKLTDFGLQIRLVSMPSTDKFEQQDQTYKHSVLPDHVEVRVAVEAGCSDGWYKYVGLKGRVVGINSFGKSAPGEELMQHFGITADNIMQAVKLSLGNSSSHKKQKKILKIA